MRGHLEGGSLGLVVVAVLVEEPLAQRLIPPTRGRLWTLGSSASPYSRSLLLVPLNVDAWTECRIVVVDSRANFID